VASKRWSVGVTDLAGTAQLHELTVDADNWMSALRSGRSRIGEDGGVPQGASCAVSPDGVVTILDPVSRRRFTLTQRAAAAAVSPSAPPPAAPAPQPVAPVAVVMPEQTEAPGAKRRKFQTVAFDASMALPVRPQAEPVAAQAPAAVVAVGAPVRPTPAGAPGPTAQAVATTSARPGRSSWPAPAPAAQAAVSIPRAAPVPVVQRAPAPVAVVQPAPTPAHTESAAPTEGKRRKFQTVAFDASTLPQRQPAAAAQVAPTFTAVAPTPAAPVTQTAQTAQSAPVQAAAPAAPASQPQAAAPRASTPSPARPTPQATTPEVHLLHQRSEEPTPKNPLAYRERSFVITGNATPASAEAALRTELAKLQAELANAPRGKFVNLALFDHRWQDRPQRPPIATLQWKDWKGAPEIAFPPQPQAQAATATAAPDDRLATAFEALQDLPFLSTAAEGLEFAVNLLGDMIASEAIAACLYDINTDELRVVAAAGTGAQERKTQAIPVTAGVFGQAARAGDRALAISNVQLHAGFDPALDTAPGLQARNMLLRPLLQEGQLFGVLQLTNRVGIASYTNEDVNLINYIAERVAAFVRQAKLRGR